MASDEERARELFQRFNEIECDPDDGRTTGADRLTRKFRALLAFSAAVRADEREACAKVGDDYALTWSRSNKPEAETTYNVCRTIARAIRARTP